MKITVDFPDGVVERVNEFLEHVNQKDGTDWVFDAEQVIAMVDDYVEIEYYEKGCLKCKNEDKDKDKK